MRKFRTALGVILILVAIGAMYYWTTVKEAIPEEEPSATMEKIEEIVTEMVAEPEPEDERYLILQRGQSLFPIEDFEFCIKSDFLQIGDWIGIYHQSQKGKLVNLGRYEIVYIDDVSLEIICSLEEFLPIKEAENQVLLARKNTDAKDICKEAILLVLEEPMVKETEEYE